jgi:pimeloyl-ACP methyl ester carboxylesterase
MCCPEFFTNPKLVVSLVTFFLLVFGPIQQLLLGNNITYDNNKNTNDGSSCQTITTMDEIMFPTNEYKLAPLLHGNIRYYLSSEDQSLPLVVLIHGLSGPLELLSPLGKRLAVVAAAAAATNSKNRRVLLFDLYGRGPSDSVQFEIAIAQGWDIYIEQLVDLLFILKETKPFDLVGLSMGGALAARFAQVYPSRVSTLTLLAPAGTAGSNLALNGIKKLLLSFNRYTLSGLAERIIPILVRKNFEREYVGNHSSEALEFVKVIDHTLKMYLSKYSMAIAGSVLSMDTNKIISSYQQIDVCKIPTLLIWGDQDKVAPLDTWGRELESILKDNFMQRKCSPATTTTTNNKNKNLKPPKLVVIENAAHFAILETPDQVTQHIMEFIDQ